MTVVLRVLCILHDSPFGGFKICELHGGCRAYQAQMRTPVSGVRCAEWVGRMDVAAEDAPEVHCGVKLVGKGFHRKCRSPNVGRGQGASPPAPTTPGEQRPASLWRHGGGAGGGGHPEGAAGEGNGRRSLRYLGWGHTPRMALFPGPEQGLCFPSDSAHAPPSTEGCAPSWARPVLLGQVRIVPNP